MMFLPIGKGVTYRWRELETKGQGPEGRYHHGMYFYPKGNYIVVFGGRRLANPKPGIVYDSEFVEGISVLRMDSLEWYEVRFK